jgi:hypothetical protein
MPRGRGLAVLAVLPSNYQPSNLACPQKSWVAAPKCPKKQLPRSLFLADPPLFRRCASAL